VQKAGRAGGKTQDHLAQPLLPPFFSVFILASRQPQGQEGEIKGDRPDGVEERDARGVT
jgi:hypothetical protein